MIRSLFDNRYMNPPTSLAALGAALRQARSERGLTQAALAERASVPRLKVIQVEAGDGRVASRYFAQVAAALGQRLCLQPARRPTLEELQREAAESAEGAGAP
jgi:transcriptional regulator with XRE-family HTH domain